MNKTFKEQLMDRSDEFCNLNQNIENEIIEFFRKQIKYSYLNWLLLNTSNDDLYERRHKAVIRAFENERKDGYYFTLDEGRYYLEEVKNGYRHGVNIKNDAGKILLEIAKILTEYLQEKGFHVKEPEKDFCGYIVEFDWRS